MHPTQRLEACVARMTPEQYARLLACADSYVASLPRSCWRNLVLGRLGMAEPIAAALRQRWEHYINLSLWLAILY